MFQKNTQESMVMGDKSSGSELQASEEKMVSASSGYSSQGIRELGIFPRERLLYEGERQGTSIT